MHPLFFFPSPNQQAVEHAAHVSNCHHVSSLTSFEFLKFDLICLYCHMQTILSHSLIDLSNIQLYIIAHMLYAA